MRLTPANAWYSGAAVAPEHDSEGGDVAAFILALGLFGQVLDAASDRPLAGATVLVEQGNTRVTCEANQEGRFRCPALSPGKVAISIAHPDYQTLKQESIDAAAAAAAPMLVRLVPNVLVGPEVEIETTFEALKPSMVRQEPFAFPLRVQLANAGKRLERRYRVCVLRDGSISAVARISKEEADVDDTILMGIRAGWAYRELPRTACFDWRVELHFDGGKQKNRGLLPATRP